MIIIGITGKARSGKDTFGDLLGMELQTKEPLATTVGAALAYPIKMAVAAMLDCCGIDVNKYPKEKTIPEVGASPRELYQTLGTEWGRELLGEDVWFDLLVSRVQFSSYTPKYVVVTDVRFDNEAMRCHYVIKIERDEVEKVAEHVSEAGVDDKYISMTVSNNGTLAALKKKAAGMAALIIKEVREDAIDHD